MVKDKDQFHVLIGLHLLLPCYLSGSFSVCLAISIRLSVALLSLFVLDPPSLIPASGWAHEWCQTDTCGLWMAL